MGVRLPLSAPTAQAVAISPSLDCFHLLPDLPRVSGSHGASGHLGSAIVAELLAAGHDVVGFARSDTAAPTVTALGAIVRRGDLEDLDGLPAVAADSGQPEGVSAGRRR